MSVQRYRKDPRALADRRADQEVLRLFERGRFITVDAATERETIAHLKGRYQARRERGAFLGKKAPPNQALRPTRPPRKRARAA